MGNTLPCRQLDPLGLHDGAWQGRAQYEAQPPGQGSAGLSAHESLSAAAGGGRMKPAIKPLERNKEELEKTSGARPASALEGGVPAPRVCSTLRLRDRGVSGGVAFRKRIYRTLEQLQSDLDAWLTAKNNERPHQGRWCYGKTPKQTFLDSLPVANNTA